MVFFNSEIYSQNKSYFKSGFYKDLIEFDLRTSSSNSDFKANKIKTTLHYRLKYKSGKRIKSPFAVSDGEKLYIKTKSISDNLSNDYWIILSDEGSVYSIASKINDKLIYLEEEELGKTIAFIGIATAKTRGIIYEHETKKFTVLKKNSDLFDFLNRNSPELIRQYCIENSNDKVKIEFLRKIISHIFNQTTSPSKVFE